MSTTCKELLCYTPDHLTDWLIPWCRVLLENFIVPQLVKNYPLFCATRRFIIAFTTASHLSIALTTLIQSTPAPSYLFQIHFSITLPSTFTSFKCSFPPALPNKIPYASFPFPIHATCPTNFVLLDLMTQITFGETSRQWSFWLCSLLHSSAASTSLAQISSSAPYFRTPSAYVPPSMWETKFQTHTKQVKSQFFLSESPSFRIKSERQEIPK